MAQLLADATSKKTDGNARLSEGSLHDALACYTQGLELIDDPGSCGELRLLCSQLHTNRAHVLLRLAEDSEAGATQYLKDVRDDCEKALCHDARNAKAYWRSATASIRLGEHAAAARICERGLESLQGSLLLEEVQLQAHQALAGGAEVCTICYMPLFGRGMGTKLATCALECGHVFHRACVGEVRRHGITGVCHVCCPAIIREERTVPQMLDEAVVLCTRSRREAIANGGQMPTQAMPYSEKAAELLQTVLQLEPENRIALANLGHLYHHGYGVDKSFDLAADCWCRAAGQGMAIAQFNMATAYLNGSGVKKNLSMWLKLLEQAAEQCLAPAQSDLGSVYFEGKHVTQNYDRSFDLFHKAAAQGWAPAMRNLATMHVSGRGLKMDRARGMELLTLAATQGDGTASFCLAEYFSTGLDSVVQKDSSKSLKFLEMAAEQGNVDALQSLGIKYKLGEELPRDGKKAVQLLQRASVLGSIEAKVNLGFVYNEGQLVPRNRDRAADLLQDAAAQGASISEYLYGLGVDYTKDEAVDYSKAADARQGWLASERPDFGKAAELWKAAAAQGHVEALNGLGLLYSLGFGVAMDKTRAAQFYSQAAEKGHALAAENLEQSRLAGCA